MKLHHDHILAVNQKQAKQTKHLPYPHPTLTLPETIPKISLVQQCPTAARLHPCLRACGGGARGEGTSGAITIITRCSITTVLLLTPSLTLNINFFQLEIDACEV